MEVPREDEEDQTANGGTVSSVGDYVFQFGVWQS
jgi:hypothetical protein